MSAEERMTEALREARRLLVAAGVPDDLRPTAFRWALEVLWEPHAMMRDAEPKAEPSEWRCPRCGGRAQALVSDHSSVPTYGCQRSHPLVVVTEAEIREARR